ncbi:MAG: hypothetical protein NTZ11_18880 [Gammaproteobacteria bacterium]|nr:hypothetical protein [Gammaproteobacteria bacterium]
MSIKSLFTAVLLLVSAVSAVPASAADVGVSINIGQPGFYGRIDIDNAPRPRIIYREPVIIERRTIIEQPYYVRVPPIHRRNWRRYCSRYDACGRPVYFVDNAWYNNVYVPHYRGRHDHRNGRHDDRRDDRRDDDRGRGRGNRRD